MRIMMAASPFSTSLCLVLALATIFSSAPIVVASSDNKANLCVSGGAANALRKLGQDQTEAPSHKADVPMSQITEVTDREAPLMNNIQLLSDILADTVKRGNPRIHDLYQDFRQLGLDR